MKDEMQRLVERVLVDKLPPADCSTRIRHRLRVFSDMTINLTSLSTCKRLQVGCCVCPQDLSEVLSIGYNGQPSGSPNDGCRAEEGACGCIHAEANCLVKLKSNESGLLMIVTHSPCEHCAGLIVNSKRIRYVMYEIDYRDLRGTEILNRAGIFAVKLSKLLGTGEEF